MFKFSNSFAKLLFLCSVVRNAIYPEDDTYDAATGKVVACLHVERARQAEAGLGLFLR